MADLKTLKDFDILCHMAGQDIEYVNAVELRENAKEWIKKIELSIKNDMPLDLEPLFSKDVEKWLGKKWKSHYASIITFIEYFFNLKEMK